VTSRCGFIDQDGGVVTGRLCSWETCSGPDMVCADIPVAGVSSTSGSIRFHIPTPTTCPPGDYPGTMQVIDSRGNESNVLTGTFTVISPPVPPHEEGGPPAPCCMGVGHPSHALRVCQTMKGPEEAQNTPCRTSDDLSSIWLA